MSPNSFVFCFLISISMGLLVPSTSVLGVTIPDPDTLAEVSLTSSAVINAPIQQIWPIQSNFAEMQQWYPTFSSVDLLTSLPLNAVGSERECKLAAQPQKFIRERLVAFDPSRFTYSYSVIPYEDQSHNPLPFPLFDHQADVRLYPLTCSGAQGSTFVQWSIRFKTLKDKAALATKVNQSVFGTLFSQLQAYFNDKRQQTRNFDSFVSTNGQTSTLRTMQGCIFYNSTQDQIHQIVNDVSSPIFTTFTPTDALKSVKPSALTRRMYHFYEAKDHAAEGYAFPLIEDVLPSKYLTNTSSTVSWVLSGSPNLYLNGVTSHVGIRHVFPLTIFSDPSLNGRKAPTDASVVIWEDELQLSHTQDEFVSKFVTWFADNVFDHIHQRVTNVPDYTFGHKVRRVFTDTFLMSSDLYWTAFDDYLAVQLILSGHEDLKVDPENPLKISFTHPKVDPENPLKISFTHPGFSIPTVEELTVKDNSQPLRVWRIALPVPNAIFAEYSATVYVADVTDSNFKPRTHATIVIDFTLLSTDEKARKSALAMTDYFITIRLQQIATFVAKQHGINHAYETFYLDFSPGTFFNYMADWSNTIWVETSLGAAVSTSGTSRWVHWSSGRVMMESMIDVNPSKQTFTYFVEPPDNLGCQIYAGEITVTNTSINGQSRAKIDYISHILPAADRNSSEVVNTIVKLFLGRFDWLQKTFTNSKTVGKSTKDEL